MTEGFTETQLEAALERLTEAGRLTAAEQRVARVAPQLQRILAAALAEGGWFEDAHADEARAAVALEHEADRVTAVRTLLAEEARMGMLIGVALGWELARELELETDKGD